MRAIAATLSLAAAFCAGCGPRPTGILSTDLDSLVVTVAVDGPASVEGIPRRGLDPLEIALLSVESGVVGIELHCDRGDSAVAAASLCGTAGVPAIVRVSGTSRLIADVEGLSWTPRYSWFPEGDIVRFEANVIIHNATNQTWRGVSMRIIDTDGLSLASTTGLIDLPPGDEVVPWWNATGTALDPVIIYSWPVPGAWTALLPVVVQGAGPFIEAGVASNSPIVSGDTVWIPAPDLEISQTSIQTPRGYDLEVTLSSSSQNGRSVRVRYPSTLSSGAMASFDVPSTVTVGGTAGTAATFHGTLRYSTSR